MAADLKRIPAGAPFGLDPDTTISDVTDAVSSAAGLDRGDSRRDRIRACVRGSWDEGRRLPLELVSAGFRGVGTRADGASAH